MNRNISHFLNSTQNSTKDSNFQLKQAHEWEREGGRVNRHRRRDRADEAEQQLQARNKDQMASEKKAEPRPRLGEQQQPTPP